MGFGILFIGYFFCLNVTFNLWTDVFAYLIMLYAMSLLSRYEKNFKYASYLLIPLVISAGVGFGFNVYEFTGGTFSAALVNHIGITEYVFALAVTFFMLRGIRELAAELELHDIKYKAVRNTVFSCVYYAAMVFLSLNLGISLKIVSLLSAFFLLFGFITIALNAALIYSCYRWICLEGDEDNLRKKSRFAFINKLYDELDKKEARALQKTVAELDEKNKRRAAKNNNKKKRRKQ